MNHRVIRIENLEVLEALGLKRRKGFCYSLAEVLGDERRRAAPRQVRIGQRDCPKTSRNSDAGKFLELAEKMQLDRPMLDGRALRAA